MATLDGNSDQYANVSSNSPSLSSSSSSSSSSFGGVNSDDNNGSVTWYGMRLPSVNPFLSPLSFLLDYSGILRSNNDSEVMIVNNGVSGSEIRPRVDSAAAVGESSAGEVAIRIIGAGEHIQNQVGEVGYDDCGEDLVGERSGIPALDDGEAEGRGGIETSEGVPLVSSPSSSSLAGSGQVDGDTSGNGTENNSRDSSSYQRYDIQLVAKWIEQILPFSLLLLVVFIRQHLQGFFVTIWIAAVMFKSNEIVKKQTALKGDRKVSLLAGISIAFILHVICIYWWYRNDDILYPLVMLPPSPTPFWHAIFTILVNDILMRQVAMAFKCILLIYYKKGKGHNFRRQAQMLTLVEYTLLLYRALLPTPVWYRFFLNREYGSLFSSLTTGLYLTFKLTSVVEKVQCFISAVKALSRKEVHYGVYATAEQVTAAGDLCAICQEKMHSPILLRCKHIFCEDCVSEWFERERTCPLCRALVKAADLRTFGDGSTSLFFQLF
ncbi:E3 ubiquitin-protein ligase RNFT1-like [Trifolium pratense]|uniref:E3 ubiquitin-protein ligase RNFT1-like n=1 Tax=Trifolium pratense TaxID=57577 RepID=UPI001E68FDF9|nr:E3 ubiquitin-protein ligase RNFT1-like [Trifolium pratense]